MASNGWNFRAALFSSMSGAFPLHLLHVTLALQFLSTGAQDGRGWYTYDTYIYIYIYIYIEKERERDTVIGQLVVTAVRFIILYKCRERKRTKTSSSSLYIPMIAYEFGFQYPYCNCWGYPPDNCNETNDKPNMNHTAFLHVYILFPSGGIKNKQKNWFPKSSGGSCCQSHNTSGPRVYSACAPLLPRLHSGLISGLLGEEAVLGRRSTAQGKVTEFALREVDACRRWPAGTWWNLLEPIRMFRSFFAWPNWGQTDTLCPFGESVQCKGKKLAGCLVSVFGMVWIGGSGLAGSASCLLTCFLPCFRRVCLVRYPGGWFLVGQLVGGFIANI